MDKIVEKIRRDVVEQLNGFRPSLPDRTVPELCSELSLPDVVKLSFNESYYGPSPKAMAAVTEILGSVFHYHDPEFKNIRSHIAAKHGVAQNEVYLSNGGDEAVSLLTHAFLSAGDEAVMLSPTFGQYALATRLMGAKPVLVPVKNDMSADFDALIAAITPRTKLLFFCNPNNPTGSTITGEPLVNFLAKIPPDVIVILDEAYGEYVTDEKYVSGIQLFRRFPNIVTVRTFSKIYGLAAMRIGFAIAHPAVVDSVNRIRNPFNVNLLAVTAAVAALHDKDYMQSVRAANRAERQRLTRELTAMGFTVYPSEANFLFADSGVNSQELNQKLACRGVVIRPATGWGFPTHVRITIGRPEQNDVLLKALHEIAGSIPKSEQ